MGPLNPEMDTEAFRLAAEAQEPLIEVADGALGSMRAERWATLASQLQQLGLVAEPQPAERYFANP
jgi:pyruvate/2-oxoacid:ferredoxin oxidoreductase alpha subunit